MNVATILFAVFFLAALVCALLANREVFGLKYEINQQLPAGEQFEPLFWSFFTWEKLWALQTQYLPDSDRPKKIKRYKRLMFIFFGGTAVMLFLGKSLP